MRPLLVAAGLALCAPAAPAQSVPTSGPPITEADYLAAALADSATAAILADLGADEEATRRAAGQLSNPALEFEREAPGAVRQNTARVSWRPPLDGRRGLRIAADDAAWDAARSRREAAELALRLDLRAAFAEWAFASERVTRLQAHADRLRELSRQADERAARGEESGLNARRFAFAALEIAAELARARAEALAARSVAGAFAPGTAERHPSIPDLPDAAPPPTAENAELAALRAERSRADLERRLAGRVFEFPEIFAGWQWQEDEGFEADGPVLGLSWELPLFERGQAARLRADRGIAGSRARESLAARRLQPEATARFEAYGVLRAAASSARETAAPAEATVEAALAAFRYGEITMTDLLDAVRSTLAGQLAALDLQAAALAAHRELERAAGRPLPR